jgi:hypothetical protein
MIHAEPTPEIDAFVDELGRKKKRNRVIQECIDALPRPAAKHRGMTATNISSVDIFNEAIHQAYRNLQKLKEDKE